MIDRKKIEGLIEEQLGDSDQFLVELKISETNNIEIFIDSDTQVGIDDCIGLSRMIESNLDREEEDFELRVSSAGLDLPLRKKRQYRKHLNKLLKVKTNDGNQHLLRLENISEDSIQGTPLKKNPNAKKGAKKQFTEQEAISIPFDTITETKIEVIF